MKKKYNIIYADPPWEYNKRNNTNTKFGGGIYSHYDSMKIDDICKMEIPSDDNCALFLWVTFPKLEYGMRVIKEWGFTYKTIGFNWVKTNKNNTDPFFGVGYYTKSNTEVCLLGIKGKMKPISNKISSVVIHPRMAHSKKPDVVRDNIVELFGDVPRLEMFARQKTEGWDVFGNQVNDSVDLYM